MTVVIIITCTGEASLRHPQLDHTFEFKSAISACLFTGNLSSRFHTRFVHAICTKLVQVSQRIWTPGVQIRCDTGLPSKGDWSRSTAAKLFRYRPHTDNIPTVFTDHILTAFTDHIPTTYRPPLSTTYRPLYGQINVFTITPQLWILLSLWAGFLTLGTLWRSLTFVSCFPHCWAGRQWQSLALCYILPETSCRHSSCSHWTQAGPLSYSSSHRLAPSSSVVPQWQMCAWSAIAHSHQAL